MIKMSKKERKELIAIYDQIELYTDYIDSMNKNIGKRLYYKRDIAEDGNGIWENKNKTIKMSFEWRNSPICKNCNGDCNKCVITLKVNGHCYDKTPFHKIWDYMYSQNQKTYIIITKEFINYVKEELEFLRSIVELDDTLNCYDPETHECDGRCQGCSDCPKAEYIKGIRKTCSRRTMLKYIEKSKRMRVLTNKFFLSDECQEMTKKLAKKCKRLFGE